MKLNETRLDASPTNSYGVVDNPHTTESNEIVAVPSSEAIRFNKLNIDTGRRTRVENLQLRNRAAKATSSGRIKQSSYFNSYFSVNQFSGDLSQ